MRSLAALALYLIVLGGLTWPLARHLDTHLPATTVNTRSDLSFITWALAWESHALATDPAQLLDANVYHPTRRALLYGDPGFGALPFFAPVFLATGNPTLAINVVLLACLALSALGLQLAVVRFTGSHLAGLAAGLTLVTNPWATWTFLPWAPSYAVLVYLPAIAVLVTSDRMGPGRMVALAALIALQCLANVVYVAAATLGTVTLLGCGSLLRPSTRRHGRRVLAATALAIVLLSPLYAGFAAVRAANPDLRHQSVWQPSHRPIRAGLERYFVSLEGELLSATQVPPGPFDADLPVRITWTATAVIALALVRARGTRRMDDGARSAFAHGLAWTAIGLAFGTAAVSWFGAPAVVLPHYRLAAHLAPLLIGLAREPSRLGIPALVGVALLTGAAFATVIASVPATRRRLAAGTLATLVAIGLCLEHRPRGGGGYPLAAAIDPDSAVVRALAAGHGPVLELPVGSAGINPALHARAMYRSIFHWRPLLNGYNSYWPQGFLDRMALAARLPDPDALAALRRDTGLSSIVVDLGSLPPATRGAWRAIAAGARPDLRPVASDVDGLVVVLDVSEG